MGRYERMFERLSTEGAGAFVPFVVIGDPNIGESLDIIRALIEGGADALELGIPFSDPIADGPTIQAATVRALESGVTPPDCFAVLKTIRGEYPNIPIGLLVYANLVVANGEVAFYRKVADADVDSVLVADVPAFESGPFVKYALGEGVSPVFIAPPNATEALISKVAEITKGYTYVVARPGVTGTESSAQIFGVDIFKYLAKYQAPPGLLGFGISTPENVNEALDAGAAGAISGSAVVRIIEKNLGKKGAAANEIRDFVKQMKAATRNRHK
ncbi:MAG: tryptophan synthase subunit alpha [Proteobacteria bacterium]|nr:tryptophan synthase subunit alpha [Pseudomonadota bacterium]